MASSYSAVHVPENSIPTPERAALQYEQAGGHLKHFGTFGVDPLEGHPILIESRRLDFHSHFPSFDMIFSDLVNGKPDLLRQAMILFIRITKDLEACR